jgi:hypothetical protein
MMMRGLVIAAVLVAMPLPAAAGKRDARSCLRALDQLGVDYVRQKKPGIEIGVRVRGPLGGVTYKQYDDKPLIIDCSLAVSLAASGRWLVALGFDTAIWSGAYHVRNVKGSKRRSKHSYGLAIDVHQYNGTEGRRIVVKDDYEQGLGDAVDCIGAPLTEAGTLLKTIDCQMRRSGMFRFILDPDYDGNHHHHFHIETKPWQERVDDPVRVARAES